MIFDNPLIIRRPNICQVLEQPYFQQEYIQIFQFLKGRQIDRYIYVQRGRASLNYYNRNTYIFQFLKGLQIDSQRHEYIRIFQFLKGTQIDRQRYIQREMDRQTGIDTALIIIVGIYTDISALKRFADRQLET